jgi:hypothetical protein
MSDDKQPKIKRAATPPRIVKEPIPAPKPVAVAPSKPIEVMPPKPAAVTAPKWGEAAPSKPIEGALPEPIVVTPPKPVEVAPPKPVDVTPPKPIEVAPPMPEPKAALPVYVPEPARNDERWFATYRATLASISESQAAIASGAAALGLEMTGLTRSYLTAAGDSAVAFFTARNLVDAVEAQLGFARRSIDALAGGSTRLGEVGLRLADDAAKPVFRSFAAG